MSLNWSQTLQTAEKHLSRGNITAAIADYRKLCNWDPTDLTVLNALGDLCLRTGLNGEATEIFTRAAREYRHQGFTSKAIAILKKVQRINPNDLDSAMGLAECYVEQGLLGEASRQYADVAEAYERSGRSDKSLGAYQRLVEIDPSNASLQMMLGERWLRDGQSCRAHSSFTAAGDQYSRQGAEGPALAAYLKAREAQPDDYKTLASIVAIYTARGQAESAIPILCDSLTRNAEDAGLLKLLGSTYLSAERLADAERTCQKLLALDPDEYPNLLIIGDKFLETGDLDRAVETVEPIVDRLIANRFEQVAVDFLRKVLDQAPEHTPSLRALALVFRRVREDFNLAPVLQAIADGAVRRGERDEAIDALKELCALEPHERSHRDALLNLGIEPPNIPLALCSSAENLSPSSPPRSEYSWDPTVHLRSRTKDNPCKNETRKTVSSARPSFAFITANQIPQEAPSSRYSVARPETPKTTPARFELVPVRNRRTNARIPARVPLVVISDAGGWREFTETVDIAEGGLKLKLAHTPSPMTSLRVSFGPAKWPEAFEGTSILSATSGVVRYCKQELGRPNIIGFDLRPTPAEPVSDEPLIDSWESAL